MALVDSIFEARTIPFSKKERAIIEKALAFSQEAHKEQKRLTGEPYFCHAYETAKTLSSWNMETPVITAGLLHDTIEDAVISEDEIEKEFGTEVLTLVQGVTKLGGLRYHGVERHVESLRKFFLATADDVRVLLIKLADRLHNVKTLHGHTSATKQKRIALETIELYAPLAYRLGMGEVKGELEDYAFPYAHPKEYDEVQQLLKKRSKKDERYLQKIRRSLQKELVEHDITPLAIDFRVKHLLSLYRKLKRYDMNIDKVYDIIALRIIVESVEECYRILGIIHSKWKPLPEKVKDYIATPKTNGYQSLHTTIFTGDGGIAEIQIRTQKMHEQSEFGIAAHMAYKEGGAKPSRHIKETLSFLAHAERSPGPQGNEEYLKNIKDTFFENSIFVFTPKGDVIELPEGATALDFAYAIHSDIGNHTAGARINGKFVALSTKLSNRDIVAIETKRGSRPTLKWLEYATTQLAKRHIRSYIAKEKTKS